MRGRWIRSASSLLLLLGALSAQAQDAAETKAREHFKTAQAAYNLGQFSKALEGYSAAYEAKPLPAFLFNIGQCHKQLGNWERAAFFYKRFLATGDESVDREKVQQLITQVEQRQADAVKQRSDAQSLELERAKEASARAEAIAAQKRAEEAAVAAKIRSSAAVETPLYQRWWLWAGVGGAVAAGITITAVALAAQPRSEVPTYGQVNAR